MAALSPPASPSVSIVTRCSFATRDAFQAAENELSTAQRGETRAKDIRRRPTRFVDGDAIDSSSSATPPFVTAARLDGKFELKTEAAKRNDHAKTPYEPPSSYCHRIDSPPPSWRAPHVDFQAKFHLPSTQDLRRSTALDQEGFFADVAPPGTSPAPSPVAGSALLKSDLPGARRPGSGSPMKTGVAATSSSTACSESGGASPLRTAAASPVTPSSTATSPTSQPAFVSRVPHTTRKSSNVELRLEKIVDQEGLLPQLHEVRSHRFREDAATVVPFRAAFKPAPSLRPIGGD